MSVLALAAPPAADAASLATGRAEYSVSWNGIPAGGATIEVQPEKRTGRPIYRVDALAQTNWLVDWLWHFQAHAVSRFTSDGLAPLGYHYDREENAKHIITDVTFSPSMPGATGTYYRGNDRKVIELQEPNVLDPITAVFHALAQPMRAGDVMRYEVFTGEARYRIELSVMGEDVVSVTAGTYRTWRIEPAIWKLGTGVDTRLRRATIWVSDEAGRIPVRIRSEVFIGAVNCDLLRFHRPGARSPG